MPTPPELAQRHADSRLVLVNAAAMAAEDAWAAVDPDRIALSWTQQVPQLLAVTSGAQLAAARDAEPYLDEVLDAEGLSTFDAAPINPRAFVGSSSGVMDLAGMLFQPVIGTLLSVRAGASVDQAMTVGRHQLDTIVRTQVADAGRVADGVALTARPAATGYVRVVVGKTCSRCVLLAGRKYRWNAGFDRHPRCDCVHLPCEIADAGGLVQSPRRIYDRLTPAQRSEAGWTLADQRALGEGADIYQVTNAHRGVYTAGGRRFTREGTTKRGFARSRLGGRKARLTPEQIYREAGDDRDKALRLLYDNGYLAQKPALVVARSMPAPSVAGGGRAAGAAAPAGAVRPVLAAARTTSAVQRVFSEEFGRITGGRTLTSVRFTGSAATAREHAEGLLRGLELFPEANLDIVSAVKLNPGSVEYAFVSGRVLSFNPHWTEAASRSRYLEAVAEDVRTAWHPRGTGSPVGIAAHEFGHVLDLGTLGQARRKEITALLERRAIERDARIAAQKAAGELVDAEDWAAGSGVDGLISREISRYATRNADELVAEAFVDVVMNGPAAAPLSREIFNLIEAEYRRGGRRLGVTIASASESAPLAGLSKLTIPKLKEIARERGITVPARAKKADILALLEGPPSAAPLAGAAALRAAARERNRLIEARGPVEDMLAEVDELLGKKAATNVMLEHLDALVDRVPTADLAALRKAVETGDRAKIRATVTRIGTKNGLKATAPAGKAVTFDPALHELPGGGTVPDGAKVVVIRRGTTLTINGETITFNRAKVAVVEPPKPKLPSQSARRLDELMDDLAQKLRAMLGGGGNTRAYAEARKAALKEVRAAVTVKHGAIRSMVDAIEPQGDSLRIRGRIMDGRVVAGTFERFFARDVTDGKLVAHHSFLMLDRKYQGSGFAREFNQNLYDWYRRSGFDRVMTHANIDVGGYTWATQGFDFRDRQAFELWADRAKSMVERIRVGQRPGPRSPAQFGLTGLTAEDAQAQLDQFELLLLDAESGRRQVSAYEFSQLGRKPGQGKDDMWIGKHMMLGSDWFGAKPL